MNIEISTPYLNADISRMREKVDALVASKTQVYRCLENLSTMWEGPAHSAFTAQTRTDEVELQALINEVNDLIACLRFAAQEYDRCTDEVDSKIASIRVSNNT